jgi:Integrase core domain
MNNPGYENAHSDSFNAVLKRQELSLNEHQTIEESARGIFCFIEKYVEICPHSALGELTPREHREQNPR